MHITFKILFKMTDTYNEKFADRVAQLSTSKFMSLGKTGKPKDHTEWTLLACILQLEEGNLQVVSLGTGSKCIGASQLTETGDILHDSHAEVVARRAFMLYLLEQIDRAVKGQESLFQEEEGKYIIREGVTFHFYVSHTPCGDASIFPKQEWDEYYGDSLKTSCTQHYISNQEYVCDTHPVTFEQVSDSLIEASKDRNEFEQPAKKLKKSNIISSSGDDTKYHQSKSEKETPSESWSWAVTEKSNEKSYKNPENQDIHRTGAKTVEGEQEDPRLPGADYHVTGALRTKPGRGDPTLSMSCSDKIFKWTVLGVQGALLMLFLKSPVYLETMTIGHCPYSQEAMLRALFSRFQTKLKNIQLPEGFRIVTPHLLSSGISFPFSRDSVTHSSPNPSKVMPSPTCLIWSNTSTHQDKHEVATNGRKHGITKKAIGTPKSWVSICCKSLLLKIKDIAHTDQCNISNGIDFTNQNYGKIKAHARSYCQAWRELKSNVLDNWTAKPNFVKTFKV
ncbi:tRNA-specific adenosine deaminase 1-like [Penaeus monodon]|uniref:tRNA-specific adenosine deaminase 1-like n=1 Tax=Penaeus monodon TaxID=6687 RepID=UPI0018A77DB7|nr:tRNA-specific adenosine deaminase 1-like [Penaeus monodon]